MFLYLFVVSNDLDTIKDIIRIEHSLSICTQDDDCNSNNYYQNTFIITFLLGSGIFLLTRYNLVLPLIVSNKYMDRPTPYCLCFQFCSKSTKVKFNLCSVIYVIFYVCNAPTIQELF